MTHKAAGIRAAFLEGLAMSTSHKALAESALLVPKPVFVSKIWGSRKLEERFGYHIPSGPVGECWGISAHPNGDCLIADGPYGGRRLSELWDEERQLFGSAQGDRFPLLIKILDVNDWLSVQVHPDDAYAAKHENGSLGKSECWYVIDAAADACAVVGQKAHDREEFSRLVEARRWDELLNKIPIHAGDFISVTAGTLHAIKGALLLETQQSSDLTYRVYDFDRRQSDGSLRELHLEKALDVIDFSRPPAHSAAVTAAEVDGITPLMSCAHFDVWHARPRPEKPVELSGKGSFLCVSAIGGSGGRISMEDGSFRPIKQGDHVIIAAQAGCAHLEGDLELIVSRPS